MTTVLDVQRFKDEGRRFAMLTAYDFLSARILDEAGIPILLVGDSLHDDVEAAMRAGLSAVLVDRRKRHESANHVPRISSLKEVLDFLAANP